jgi:hypothetical protein
MSTGKFHRAITVSMLAIAAASQANAADLGIPVKAPAASDAADGYFFNLQPLGAEAGKALANYGIYINGRTLNTVQSNVSGGLKSGSFYEASRCLASILILSASPAFAAQRSTSTPMTRMDRTIPHIQEVCIRSTGQPRDRLRTRPGRNV